MAIKKMSPGEIVKAIRDKDSQEDFAPKLGMTPQHLSRVENNHRGVSKRVVKILIKMSKGAYSPVDFF